MILASKALLDANPQPNDKKLRLRFQVICAAVQDTKDIQGCSFSQ